MKIPSRNSNFRFKKRKGLNLQRQKIRSFLRSLAC
nr:MAG TPA: hypothetical protein [Caudoviricetes sp.]